MLEFNEELVNAGAMVDGDGLAPSANGARVRWEKGDISDRRALHRVEGLVAGYWVWEVSR